MTRRGGSKGKKTRGKRAGKKVAEKKRAFFGVRPDEPPPGYRHTGTSSSMTAEETLSDFNERERIRRESEAARTEGKPVTPSVKNCTCGHVDDEHGHDDEHPGSTACTVEGCECIAFEEDLG